MLSSACFLFVEKSAYSQLLLADGLLAVLSQPHCPLCWPFENVGCRCVSMVQQEFIWGGAGLREPLSTGGVDGACTSSLDVSDGERQGQVHPGPFAVGHPGSKAMYLKNPFPFNLL